MGILSFDTSFVLGWLFDSTLYVSLLICLIVLINSLTKGKLPAWWSYGLWLLLVLSMLLPWGIESRMSIFNYVPAPPLKESYMPYIRNQGFYMPFRQNGSSTAILTDIEQVNESIDSRDYPRESKVSNYNISLDKIILFIWFTGAVFFGVKILFCSLFFWFNIRKKLPESDDKILDLLDDCRKSLSIKRNIPIVLTDSIKGPALYGYFRPRILLPPAILNTLDETELRYILFHELGHFKRHDIAVSWLVNLLQIIHWFNPFVWYAFHQMKVDQEAACDAFILSRIKKAQPEDYANTIIDLLKRFIQNRQMPSLAGIIENKSQIRRRIAMIMNFKKYTLRTTLASIFMLLLIGLIFFTRANGLPDKLRTPRPAFLPIISFNIGDDFKLPAGSSITKISDDMNRYENREWLYAFNIPGGWQYPLPPQPMFDNHIDVNGLGSFGSNENGYHRLAVRTRQLYNDNYPPPGKIDLKKVLKDPRVTVLIPKPGNQSPKEECEDMQKMLSSRGIYEDINLMETSIGSSKAYRLDFVSKPDGENVDEINWRIYFFADKGTFYKVVFGTTNKEAMSDIFDQIAMSFEILPEPESIEMKPFGNIYDFYSLEIPMRWHFSGLLPVYSGLPDLLVSGFNSHDDRYDALAMTRKPVTNKQTVKEYRYEMQRWLKRKGADNFKTSETTIGSNDAMVLDCNFTLENEVLNIRGYFLTNNRDLYGLLFSTNDGGNVPELYERIASSFKFTDSMPDIVCPSDDEYNDIVYKPEEVDQKPIIFNMNDLPTFPDCMSEPGFKKGVLQFIVGTDGYAQEPKWFTEPEGACEGIEDKILDYVTETRRFKPAVKDGKCVKCSFEVTLTAGYKIANW